MKRGPITRRTPLPRGGGLSSGSGLSRGSGLQRSGRVRPVARKRERVTDAVAQAVIRRSGGVCERCRSRPGSELHHKVTRARGGPHDEFNLCHLCSECHHVWAHGENEYPWLVPGRFIKGVYSGPDRAYRLHYNGHAD